jgi:hypothetical protein
MEELMTMPATGLANGVDTVNERGIADVNGLYTRTWVITARPSTVLVTVSVSWLERGADAYSISIATERRL